MFVRILRDARHLAAAAVVAERAAAGEEPLCGFRIRLEDAVRLEQEPEVAAAFRVALFAALFKVGAGFVGGLRAARGVLL